MPIIGSGTVLGFDGLMAIAEETTYGTFVTGSSFIEFESEGLTRNLNFQKLNTIIGRRGFTRRVEGQTDVSGEITYNFHAVDELLFLKNVMAGTINAARVAASITGGTMQTFTLTLGDYSQQTAPASFSLTKRVGSTTARTWAISGCRVNQIQINGAVNQPVKATVNIVGQNMTTSSSSLGTASFSSLRPFLFFDGTYTSDDTTTSFGTTAEDIVSFQLTINNNLISDANARRIGSKFVRALPAGQREVNLTFAQRFDTTTAFERYVNLTQQSIRIHMDSQVTIGSVVGNTTYSMVIDIRNMVIDEGAVPVIGDNGLLMHNLNLSGLLVNASNTITSDEMVMTVNTSLSTL